MEMINVLNKLTELSKENPSPDVKQAIQNTRKLVKEAAVVISEEQVVENEGMSLDQLAQVSDQALDDAYHYGRSSPGNTFGWQANLKSAEFAKRMIDSGETDIERISDAIHKGWNVTAKAFVMNPDQFEDTAKLKAAGKLEAKLQQREKLMNINYAQLPEEEKEKDRVVARALLQALTGQKGMAEDRIGGHVGGKKIGSMDILARRPEGGVAKYGQEYKQSFIDRKIAAKKDKKGKPLTPRQDMAKRYGLGGPVGTLPESEDNEERCMECGMLESQCQCDESTQVTESRINEKWGKPTKVAPSEKGKYAGKNKAELLKSYNALKASGPHKKGSKEYGRMRELSFAIRAKGGWGKVQEVITKKTPAGEIISDFQKSKNPKFKGKSKAKRKEMALGAYYGMHPEKSRKKVGETKLTPKQKKFAALAEPKNKITYADKIAGATKKVKETKLTPKQMKIAKAAKPTNAITGADFAALRKGRKVENALMRENADLTDMKKLAGLSECGMMGTSMAPSTPANISINASAASGGEVASMLRDLMRLAGGEAEHKPELTIVGADSMDSMGNMEEMVDEGEQDGHFADATTEPAGPAGEVFDENPVMTMTGKQVQQPDQANSRQNDNPMVESLWQKFKASK